MLAFLRQERCWSTIFLALLNTAPLAAETPASTWAFCRPQSVAVPEVRQKVWPRNAIDAFILARLEQAGLRPSTPADKLTILQRVTHDLTGLAPTDGEREAFLADESPDAYEKLVERLLASPRFGERWAQHWLDVVRYAETEGFKINRWRPEAHRYRDYVIRAFNADLPYDRFLAQQLAGDELEPDNPDAHVATGFYRLHPEESNGSDYRMIRQDILDDITDVFGSTFLGLTVGCARCHNHKFDPISQREYYGLQAFFTPILQRDDVPLATARERVDHEARLKAWNEATSVIRSRIDAMLKPVSERLFDETVVTLDQETQAALRTPPARRSAKQQQLATLASKQIQRKYARMHRRLDAGQRAIYDALQKELADYDRMKPPPLPVTLEVSDVMGAPPATFRLGNGNYLKPREEVSPEVLQRLGIPLPAIEPPVLRPQSTGRRTALVRWLTHPEHPLTSRVIVNRLWQHYFGKGIVGTPGDFGAMGEAPTHPELLDFLAAELIRQRWSLKAIHRLIVTSASYRQSSLTRDNPAFQKAQQVDPDNRLLWHACVKRREGEAIRDAMLQASGQLQFKMFGPGVYPVLPQAVYDTSNYSWDADPSPLERNRRSIYLHAGRNLHYPLFAAFDGPDRLQGCARRNSTITATQALVLLNGELALEQARCLASKLQGERGRQIQAAYLAVLGRPPTPAEQAAAETFLACQARQAGAPRAAEEALVDLCHALLNSAEFLYVE